MRLRAFLGRIYRLNLEKVFKRIGIDQRSKSGQGLINIESQTPEEKRPNSYRKRGFDEPTKFIHIGYPKSGSTAIQKGFFGQHNQILHLGCGNNIKKDYWDDHGYIDKEVNLAVEIDLRFRNRLNYDGGKVKEVFDSFFNKARENKRYHAIGLSNENFCFSWHNGIDTVEKANRLFDIFGSETQIIMILRNQKDLIESLYKESIRFGYNGSFNDYLKYIWQYKDRNFYFDFYFDRIHNLYSKLFGEENVNILFFEDFKNQQNLFLKNLCNTIKVDYLNTSIPHEYNKQLTGEELFIKRELNRRFPHTFEKGIYHPMDTHRYIPYFQDELKQSVEFEDYLDYHLRNDLCQLSKKLASKVKVEPIELSWDTTFGSKILNGFMESNFSFYSKCKLPQIKSYNYLQLL